MIKRTYKIAFCLVIAALLSCSAFVFGAFAQDAALINSEAELKSLFSKGGEARLGSDVVLSEICTVSAGVSVVLDLNGRSITVEDPSTSFAFNNLGELTLKDSVGSGSVSSRGIYNGYGFGGANTATAKLTVEGGTYNAVASDGGSAITNYGIAYINGGKFTSVAYYAIHNRSSAAMTIDGAIVIGGIYNNDKATLEISNSEVSNTKAGAYTIYNNKSTLTVKSGTFSNDVNYSTVFSKGASTVTIEGGSFSNKTKSYILAGATFIVRGGVFNGGISTNGMTISGGIFNNNTGIGYSASNTVVSGGKFTDDDAKAFASANLAEDCTLSADGTVSNGEFERVVLDGAKYNLTTTTSFVGNLYIKVPLPDAEYSVICTDVVTIDDIEYYRFKSAPEVSDIVSDIVFDIDVSVDGIARSLTASFTTDGYFKSVMEKYSEISEPTAQQIEDMSLVMNATQYANELYKLVNGGNGYSNYVEILSNEDYAKYLTPIYGVTASDAVENIEDISDVIGSAGLKIHDGYYACYAFYAIEGFSEETVNAVNMSYHGINGNVYTQELTYNGTSRSFDAKDMPIYDMLATVTVSITYSDGSVKSGSYNLASYVNGSRCDVGFAIYAYAQASVAYKIIGD